MVGKERFAAKLGRFSKETRILQFGPGFGLGLVPGLRHARRLLGQDQVKDHDQGQV